MAQRGFANISLAPAKAVAARYTGAAISADAKPLTLASGDFDGDGVPDLVAGYGVSGTGRIAIHRGNVNALWPYGAALRNGPPPAFLPDVRVFASPAAPDFLAAGDFDADGRWDVVTAQRGGNALYFLRGDGHGGFAAAQRIPLSGSITAMTSGEINRADGLTDLVVAVNTASGSKVLVYQSPMGAIKAQPETFAVSHPVTALALGRFDGTAMHDLAIAAGDEFVVIHGRDRNLSGSLQQRESVQPARVTVQKFPFAIRALTAGDFTGAGPGLAALGDDGQIHIMEHALAENSLLKRLVDDPSFEPSIAVAKSARQSGPAIRAGNMAPSLVARIEALRQSAKSTGLEWTEKSAVALPPGFAQTSPRLVATRLTGSLEEDILATDAGNSQFHVFSTVSNARHRGMTASELALAPASMKLLTSLDAQSAPKAVLPMRLNKSGLSSLVALQDGLSAPMVMPQDAPPANTFTVTNTSDSIVQVGPEVTGPPGSLRAALYNASQATGTSAIIFNIPTSDPGYNKTTGTFLIQPLSEAGPGALNDFALNPINATVILDGYTQPGASPNTLANGDNAKILIQIDGSKATTPGGSGMTPFDDVGSVYRGMVFTGWVNPQISSGSSGSTASGAEGLEANGVQDYIEGNFFGTDVTGKTSDANRIGIFADNGPGFGSNSGGNIIGGTTPQARNILSGNNNSGVLFLSTAFEAQLQGNFIGLDATGTAIVSNPQEADRSNTFDGAGLNGATITIGGILPGTANVIAGNGTNVDINDLTEGGQAADSTVQGNLIGTDVTGAIAIPNQGYGVSILHNPTDMLIGGTSPAARNIISGNLAGVYVFDNSFDNIVEGNYIGTDISGTKAVANTQQGFITGATDSSMTPAGDTTIGGSVAGAGNVISGNTMDGIQIAGTSLGPNGQDQVNQGNFVLGNFIGTDATGKASIPNGGNGVNLISSATNNIIGGTAPGSGNLIANNAQNGVQINPGSTAGTGTGNNTIANAILSNTGAGVLVSTGSSNKISQNSIYKNGELGIVLGTPGAPLANQACSSTAAGPNNLQNYPTLTGGSGTAFITATATDPSGNTSEFSNAVAASTSGNLLTLMGSFVGNQPNTAYTIEFFSSATEDPSGFGQGQTYLGNTTVTSGADCTIAINDPVTSTDADLGITLSSDTTVFEVGPDFGNYTLTAKVNNNGPATAHNVVVTDTLPAGLEISSTYCDLGPCQTPVISSLGNCTVSGSKITCTLGTLAPGATATATIPVEATGAGSLVDSASVTATETDPHLANNTASLTEAVDYNFPFIDHLDPTSALTQTSGSLTLSVYGNGFLPTSAVTVNGTAVTTTAYLDNQVCGGPFTPGFCSALQVSVPASLLGTAGTATVTVTNPDPGPGGEPNEPSSANLTLVSSCTVDPEFFGFNPIENTGDTLIPEQIEVTTNAPTCTWTAVSNDSWLTILDNAKGTGSGNIDVSVAPNTGAARTGTVTVAGQAVEIDQAAGDSTVCDYALTPPSTTIPAGGASGTVAVTTGSQCSYFVQPYPQDSTYVTGVQFITIPESSGLLVGNGNPAYTVAANPGPPRAGAIMIGGEVFTLTQAAPSCYFTLNTTAATLGVAGGTGSIAITASSPGCAWTATSSNTAQMSITSGASGTGNGTVKYSVPVNTGGPQTPTITVANTVGASAVFTLTQSSAFSCTFTVSPTSVEMSANGVSNFFSVTASYSFCQWTAASSDPTSLTIGDVSGQGGLSNNGSAVGSGAVYYRVAQNTTGAPRTLTITAGCETFTINQDGALTSNPAPAITSLAPTGTTAGSGAFTLTVNGSGFINTSVVNFNGTALVTTYVNVGQLTAIVPSALVSTESKPPVTVFNPTPGGGTSNAVDFNITAAAKLTPTLTVTPSPTSITTTQPLAVNVTVNGGSGNPTPTGSVTLTSGTYTSAATTLSAGSATINIPASSLAAGTDTLTVTYTPDAGSSSSYNSATGSNTVTVTTPTKITPTLTVAPSPASITTAQALSVKVTVNGGSGNPTPTGSVTLTSGSYTSAAAALSAGSATISIPAGKLAAGTDTLTASYTPDSASLPTYNSATGSNTVAVTAATVQVIVGTSPVGLSFSVDGTSYTSTQTLTWTVGASHTIATTSPQTSAGTQNTFASWSDGGALSHSVTAPSSAASYTATFTTSYQLTTMASPSADGTVTPASGSYYASGTVVNLTATANSGFKFASWTGTVASASSASTTVTMGAPQSVTANFVVATSPIATLTPPLAFAGTNVGTTSAAMVATLSNSGNAALNISSIAIGGGNPTDFSVTTGANACGAALAADASCSIYVTFTPASATGFTATLIVTDNATPTTQSVTLTGTGKVPPAPIATLTPSTLTFSAVSGTTTAAQTATLSNTGNAVLSISGITIGGNNPTDFAITLGANACGTTLAADASCSIYVTFTPSSAAGFSASLQVTDNAAGSPQSTTLNGTGTPPPSFTISSSGGAQTIQNGGTATYTITVTPQNGAFTNSVALSASGLPTGATGTFTPPSITPGSAPATSTLSIQTGTTAASVRPSSTWPLAAPALAIIGLLFLPGKRRRRWITLALLLVASLGAFSALTACGGGFALNQPAQSYTITVTGTSGADVQTTTVQLTVQ